MNIKHLQLYIIKVVMYSCNKPCQQLSTCWRCFCLNCSKPCQNFRQAGCETTDGRLSRLEAHQRQCGSPCVFFSRAKLPHEVQHLPECVCTLYGLSVPRPRQPLFTYPRRPDNVPACLKFWRVFLPRKHENCDSRWKAAGAVFDLRM